MVEVLDGLVFVSVFFFLGGGGGAGERLSSSVGREGFFSVAAKRCLASTLSLSAFKIGVSPNEGWL